MSINGGEWRLLGGSVLCVQTVEPQLLHAVLILLSERIARYELEELGEVVGSCQELGHQAVLVELCVSVVVVRGSQLVGIPGTEAR